MLAQHFRFHIVNNIGVDMDLSSNSANEIFQLNFRKWKITTGGALEYDGEGTLTSTAADVANGASFELTADNNSTDLHWGLHGEYSFQTDDATADGTVDLYVEWSTDGGTEYPSDAADFNAEEDLQFVASLRIDGDGAGYKRSTNFSL